MPVKVLAVGDSFVTSEAFERGLVRLADRAQVRVIPLDETQTLVPSTPSEHCIHEYAGHPRQLVDALTDEEVLAVHAAPVTDAVLDASPRLRLVCCARGGPVNVDACAAAERGIPVVTSPGKNAESVADLTLAFMLMLARGIPKAQRFLAEGGRLGLSTFEGARFFGHDLGGHVLGLVGYGNVGTRVAKRALAFGMAVRVYDPYVAAARIDAPGITSDSLENLVVTSDFVSLHARATRENTDLFGRPLLARMRQDAYFINTARESLVDEAALFDALVSNRIAGAALDVIKAVPDGSISPLRQLENVIITPHIGGATHETSDRGVAMLAVQIERFIAKQRLENVYNSVGTRH
jgi:D-3-phosphoglycerate dehydrogenase